MDSIGRRAFLRSAAAAGLGAVLPLRQALAAAPAPASTLHIGVVLPPADPAVAGVRLGAREAEHAARLFRSDFGMHEALSASSEQAAEAAGRLVEATGVQALVGGGTPAAADAVRDIAEQYGVLFFNVGCAAESMARPCGALLFHVMPSDAMRADALAAAEAPAGATALAWHPGLERFGAGQVNDRFRAAWDMPMTERAWTGWMAVKILFDAVQRASTGEPPRLARHLTSERALFDGHKGLQLSFRPGSHQLRQPLYIVADDVVTAEVPAGRVTGGMTHAQLLDTIGTAGAVRCA